MADKLFCSLYYVLCTNSLKVIRLSSNSSNETNLNSKTHGGLKLTGLNINSIRGKKLYLSGFLEVHQPHGVVIQETKIDSSVATSKLFPETCPYNIFRKDRTLRGGGRKSGERRGEVILLIHNDFPHIPLFTLENDSESVTGVGDGKYLRIKLSSCSKLVLASCWLK